MNENGIQRSVFLFDSPESDAVIGRDLSQTAIDNFDMTQSLSFSLSLLFVL